MPFLHRLACFRDDVVFLIFLYQVGLLFCTCVEKHAALTCFQRWIYRIDPKRVNEYGQVMAEEVDAAESKKNK
jgi:hypothetical protein